MSRIRPSSERIAATSSTNFTAAIIFLSHARTCSRSGAIGEVIGGGVFTIRPSDGPCDHGFNAPYAFFLGSQRGRRRVPARSHPLTRVILPLRWSDGVP
jgi:hypothetical protein